MTETTTDETATSGESTTRTTGGLNGETGRNVRTYLSYALLAGLALLALIAALQFYSNASAAIDQWVSREFRSLFQAAFNLVVLLVAASGITWQVRRLTGE